MDPQDRVVRAPQDLPKVWRERARWLRLWGGGDGPGPEVWDLAATELEQALRSHAAQTLNLQEAARLSGYTADYLGDLIREGRLPNAGRPNAPRIRRGDLPVKASAPEPRRKGFTRNREDVEEVASKLR